MAVDRRRSLMAPASVDPKTVTYGRGTPSPWSGADKAQPDAPPAPVTQPSRLDELPEELRLGRGFRRSSRPLPPLSPPMQVARMSLICLLVLAAGLLGELVLTSGLTERSAQSLALATFRKQLAQGTAPVGPADTNGHQLAHGAPVAYLEIPSIGLHQVVGEGTTPSDLFRGPGHRRDSPLPGQAGVSVIMARRAAFGAPLGRIADIRKGSTIKVTTGQGRFTYRVIDLRGAGEPAPPAPGTGAGRLLLVTAAGRAFVPAGVWRVDADLTGDAVTGPAPLLTSQTLPGSERLMGSDANALLPLSLWIECLIVVILGATWAWQRWGRGQTWIVFLPVLALVSLNASEEVIRLLPNLL